MPFDVVLLRQHDAGSRFDCVMEPQNCPMVPIVGMESLRFWMVWVQNRQHMGHAAKNRGA